MCIAQWTGYEVSKHTFNLFHKETKRAAALEISQTLNLLLSTHELFQYFAWVQDLSGEMERMRTIVKYQTNRILDFLKYWTVGGVIWLGDPALIAGRAEWHGLTSCLQRGWLEAEESREREGEGEKRQAVKDEGK